MPEVEVDISISGAVGLHTRLNINEFCQSPGYQIQWSLYVRALANIQSRPPSDPFSYYSLAGIHNWPYVSWPERLPMTHGYCVHHGALRTMPMQYPDVRRSIFLPWHRVFMLLFEQTIVAEATKLAAHAPADLRDEYMQQALKIRQPFWDWGHEMALPAIACKENVMIIIPEQDRVNHVQIRNPLYSYIFTGPEYPQFNARESWRDDPTTVEERFIRRGLRTLVYNSLTLKGDRRYGRFNNTFSGNGSLQQAHDIVHYDIGGFMRQPPVTAFDPIFLLHHSNMDRYYAMWQARNPDALYEENKDKLDPIDKPLAPFDTAIKGVPWTALMNELSAATYVPSTYEFGYQYPETLASYPEGERAGIVNEAIVRLYGPYPAPHPDSRYPLGASTTRMPITPPGLPVNAAARLEWRVWIEVKQNLVVPSFTIYLLLGDSQTGQDDWTTGPNVVGSFTTLKAPAEKCENCHDQRDSVKYGTVLLTEPLYRALSKAEIVQWLASDLDWRVQQEDGAEVVLGEGGPTGLLVGVESYEQAYSPVLDDGSPIQCDLANILGVTFDRQDHPEATSGKASKGGATSKRAGYT